MQSELLSVSRIFTESLYRIPDYQRGYSWTTKQLKEFLGDIDQLEANKNHYIGVLTLEAVRPDEFNQWNDDRWIIQSKRYTPYFVVDGQQRLTTIVILLQCIIESLSDGETVNYTSKDDIRRKFIFESKDNGISRSYLFGYQNDTPSAQFLKTEIFQETSEKHRPAEDTFYTFNLQQAKAFFAEKLKTLALPAIESLYTKVTQHLLFNIYAMASDIDVFVTFETMNNRGKPLSHLELLKNRLIYVSTKLCIDQEEKDQLRAVINDCWRAAYNFLGKNKNRPLNDNHFLLSHFYLRIVPGLTSEGGADEYSLWRFRQDDYYKDYLLDEIFNNKNLRAPADGSSVVLSMRYIYDYAHDLKATVKTYYEISNPAESRFPSAEKVQLERIGRLDGFEPNLLTLAVLLTEKQAATRLRFLELWETILFLRTISPHVVHYQHIHPIDVAIRVRSGDLTTAQLNDLMEKAIGVIQKEIDLKAALREWTKRYGFYGWKGIRYFHFEYEEYLKSASKTKREKLNWEEFSRENYEDDYVTIEHIYPQKADTLEWKAAFASYSVKERNILRNSVGNLLALSRPKNAALGRKNFSEKKSNASGSGSVGYVFGCYSENEVAKEPQWTAREIALRGVRLLTFMEKRWLISLGSNKDKLSILGLDFCLSKEKGLGAEVAKVVL